MKTVLFIEDNAEIRENMGEILALANYNVLTAENGKIGAAMALAHTPDIIVCDIMMPELDGYGVIHLLQKNARTRNIPFIFLTAMAERTELRRGMELGADDYITKPFSATELLNAIAGRLQKAAQHKMPEPEAETAERNHPRNMQEAFTAEKETQTFQKKQAIYSEGHRPFRLYHLDNGKVKVYRTNDDGKDLITAICQAGDFFGYTALLDGTVYQDTAEALEQSEISSISREQFENLMNGNPEVTQQVIKMLAGNVQEKEQQILGIAYNSLRKKVAEALMRLHGKYPSEDPSASPLLHISRDNLAAIAGTAKESLIRTLGDFRDEGLIEIKDHDITILQEKRIAEMAN